MSKTRARTASHISLHGEVGDDDWAGHMLHTMTLEEKVLLLAGKDMWRTNPIARLGVPQIKTSDGPVGVRGGTFVDGAGTASLPTGVSLAATWDRNTIKQVCSILVHEAKSKGAHVLLGPTVCLPRTPLGGRNFEAYSEDPFLTGKLAATFINELQAAGIGACIKHFAANDQEDRRFFIDEKIPERALREIALQPFQIAIRDSDPWTLMTAYNKVNGEFCSSNEYLLRQILRGEWKWDGLVMSDWFGTNSVVPSLKAGLDLEMPGPVRRRGKHVLEALKQGVIDTSCIDESAKRILRLIQKLGIHRNGIQVEQQEVSNDLPEHRAILRQAGAEGIVLLKNAGDLLPLENLNGKSMAFIGPNAERSVSSGGGSSNLVPLYRTIPVESFKREIASKFPSAIVRSAPGMIAHRYLPLFQPSQTRNPQTGEEGFQLCFWRNMTHDGPIFFTESRPSSNLVCYDGLPPELTDGNRYSYRGRSIITPKTTGTHQLSLSTCGPGKLFLDGQLLIDIPRRWNSPKSSLFMSYGSPEVRVNIEMEAGREYELLLESVSREPKPYEMTFTGMLEREEIQDGGRIGFFEHVDEDALLREACELAHTSDIVVMVVGKDHEWETETSDMISMDLPLRTNELIEAVCNVNKNVCVVNQTGSPITMPWKDDVRGIVQAWYQGQEQGNCLADVLLGHTNPCGKLPITFPKRIEDNPSFGNYPGEHDVVYYGENIYAGYRFYDHRKIEPLFPFGAGLSYTDFEYSNIRLSSSVMSCDDRELSSIEVEVDVRNTGHRAGKEIVQFYVSQVTTPGLGRPVKELKGWDKIFLAPGQTLTARTTLDRVSVSYWNDSKGRWSVDENAEFQVTAAKHSRDTGVAASFRSDKAVTWLH